MSSVYKGKVLERIAGIKRRWERVSQDVYEACQWMEVIADDPDVEDLQQQIEALELLLKREKAERAADLAAAYSLVLPDEEGNDT